MRPQEFTLIDDIEHDGNKRTDAYKKVSYNGDVISVQSYGLGKKLSDGKYEVSVRAKDEYGNEFDTKWEKFEVKNNNLLTQTTDGISNVVRTVTNNVIDTTSEAIEGVGGLGELETEIIEKDETLADEGFDPQVQGYSVQVKVVDNNLNPVEGAKVTIHSKVQETYSDSNGIAKFEGVEPGDHRIVIAYKNQVGEQSVTLTGDTVQQFDFTIQIKHTNPFLSWQVITVIGVLILIIVFLVFRSRR